MKPPVAERRPHSSTWHGITLDDPYHWLKDPGYPEVKDPDVLGYLEAENRYFDHWMAPHQATVDTLFEEMKARQPDEDESVPYQYRGYRYQWRFAKGAQYRTWYRAPVSNPDAWQVFLDEPALAEPHEYFRLGGMAVSPNGEHLLYSTDTDGSERFTMRLTALGERPVTDITVSNTLGSPIWAINGSGFYYVVLNDAWRPYQVWFMRLEAPDQPELVFEEADGSFFVGISDTQSERYVVISSGDHVTSECWLIDQQDSERKTICVAPRRHGHEYSIDHRADTLYVLSNRRQSNFDLFTAPASTPDEEHWTLFEPGSDSRYLTGMLCLKDYIIIERREQGLEQIQVVPIEGDAHIIELPEAGTVGLGTNPVDDTRTLRLYFESMRRPGTVYDYDLEVRTLQALKTEEIPSGYDPSRFQTERLMIQARDGAAVPVSIVWHVDHPPGPATPLHLYAYGAYGHAVPPGFSRTRLSLLERGFAFAIAHIRGGDDLGYAWYEAGKLDRRTNTFNDFVDVARGLVERELAASGNLYISGGSAGGELMGAVVNQAPALWAAVAAHVPFVDVLNTMLDADLPLTPIEWPEWGNPIEDEAAFRFIQSYSPYDQLGAAEYPPILVTAGLNDPRVTYWEPAKYVAKLRTLKRTDTPLLLKTNMGAGHGGKSGRFDALREVAEEYAFFLACRQASVQIADC